MWLVDSEAPGPLGQPGWSTRRQGSAESCDLSQSRDKHEVKPEFSTSYRPQISRPHAATCTGQSPGERLALPCRLRIVRPDPHIIYATDRTNNIRGSPSCTGVGVVKLGRGVSVIGVSRPRPISIRASPPDSGVVPFSSRSRLTPISERRQTPPVISHRPLGLLHESRPLRLRDHGSERLKQPCLRD